MDSNLINKNWGEIKSKIKAQWGKLSEKDIDAAKVDLDLLADKIQKAYSLNKVFAGKKIAEFKVSIQSLTGEKAADDEKPV